MPPTPVSILFDKFGNAVGIVNEGGVYKLQSQVTGAAAAGTPVSGNPLLVGGSDGTDVRVIRVDESGNVYLVGTGAAGDPATGVITIQGIANGTPIVADVGNTGGLALDETLTNGTQVVMLRSGTKGATTSSDVTSASIDANTQALHVAVVGSATDPIRIDPTGTTTQPITAVDRVAVGTVSAQDEAVTIAAQGVGNIGIQISGSWIATLQFEGTINGETWFPVQVYPFEAGTYITETTTNGQWWVQSSGLNQFRVRASAFTSQTSLSITMVGNLSASRSTMAQGSPQVVGNAWPVKITDGTSVLGTSSNPLRSAVDLNPTSGGIKAQQLSIGTSAAVQLTPSPLAGRKSLSIKCQIGGSSGIFIGKDSTVTTSTGYALFNGDALDLDIDESVEVWAIGNASGGILYILEIA